jgi:hypothetical protein
MRFDAASARYAEFGPFYAGYLASPLEILEHCRVPARESAVVRQPDDLPPERNDFTQ